MFLYGICFAKLAVGASLFRIASTKLWKHVILGCSKLGSSRLFELCFHVPILFEGQLTGDLVIFAFAYTTVGFAVSFLMFIHACADVHSDLGLVLLKRGE